MNPSLVMPATDADLEALALTGDPRILRVVAELRHARAHVTLCQGRATAERDLRMETEQKRNAAVMERDAVRGLLVKLLLAQHGSPVDTRPAHVIYAERRVLEAQKLGQEPTTEDLQILLEDRIAAGR